MLLYHNKIIKEFSFYKAKVTDLPINIFFPLIFKIKVIQVKITEVEFWFR